MLFNMLGARSFVTCVHDALARYPELEPTYVQFEPQDYQRYPVPPWVRCSDAWHAEAVVRRMLAPHMQSHWDAILAGSWEITLACGALARRVPTAVACDAVPADLYRRLRLRGIGGMHRAAAFAVHHRRFAAAVPHIRAFLPRGSECARSLIRDYHVPAAKCHLISGPQHLDVWTPGPAHAPGKVPAGPLRLLFVANDFNLKGGPLLLSAFAQSLHTFATLTIASNDPAVAALPLPAGVTLVRGKSKPELLEVYRAADLFVYPTRQDTVAQVVAEAVAAGLPCLASDVGSISDLVLNGENGYLLPPGAPASAWIEKITSLAGQRAELARMGTRSRAIALDKLDFERFASLLAGILRNITAAGVSTKSAAP